MGIIADTDIQIKEHDAYDVIYAVDVNASTVGIGRIPFRESARIPESGFASHEEDEYLYISKGTIIFGTEEGEYNLKMGSFHFTPKGKKHWCKSVQGQECELVFVLVK